MQRKVVKSKATCSFGSLAQNRLRRRSLRGVFWCHSFITRDFPCLSMPQDDSCGARCCDFGLNVLGDALSHLQSDP